MTLLHQRSFAPLRINSPVGPPVEQQKKLYPERSEGSLVAHRNLSIDRVNAGNDASPPKILRSAQDKLTRRSSRRAAEKTLSRAKRGISGGAPKSLDKSSQRRQ